MPRLILLICMLIVFASPALAAGNSVKSAQGDTEENYLLKLNFACGTELFLSYDAESLSRYNKDIQYNQTGGNSECDEPLRYLWYMCKSDAGKAAVKSAGLSKIVCKGTASPTGSLTLSAGAITVERAFEEKKPFVRSRKQFEELFKTSLILSSEDPYYDQEWRALKFKPNPVTDTKTYCRVNGEKVAWNEWVSDAFVHRREDATVQCWKDGEPVASLTLKAGVKTGYETHYHDSEVSLATFKDGRKDGEQKTVTRGILTDRAFYAGGKEQWRTRYYLNGKLSRHTRVYPDHTDEVSLAENGNVLNLRCSAASQNDRELQKWCGFDGEATHAIYDGTGKVSRVVTFKDGEIRHEGPGASDFARGSDVSYKNGKKHGEERIFDKTGKLRGSIMWENGIKDGKELKYADDGKRVITETVWTNGETRQVTEFYLNGNPKLREVLTPEKTKETRRFWDTGKVSAEGTLTPCKNSYSRWCEDGVHKTYYETGAPESETAWKNGQRHGAASRWWENGRPAERAEYADDKCTMRKSWDKDGKLIRDEEYEADGSRKLKP